MKKSVLLVVGSMVCSLAPAGEATLSSDGIFASTDANIFGSDRRRGATRTTVYEKGVTFDTSAGALTFGDGARVEIDDFVDEASWRDRKAVACVTAGTLAGVPALACDYGAWGFTRAGNTLKFGYMRGSQVFIR